MNFAIGDRSATGSRQGTYNTWPTRFKATEIRNASMTWVFNDEHPDSINDGFECPPTTEGESNVWSDVPASYHNGACGFAFADGHSEIHHWMDASTMHPVVKNETWLPLTVSAPKNDITWVFMRLSPAY